MIQPNKNKIIRYTESLCPVCLKKIGAAYTVKDDAVWFEKNCDEHGDFDIPIWSDVESFEKWNRPNPSQPPFNPVNQSENGCPYDCGLCTSHLQATCCVLLEVTQRCDLVCPICYASSGKRSDGPNFDKIMGWYDMLLKQGGPFNIQLSGGEPTQRDDLPTIIKAGKEKGFTFFQLNTNGIRIADDLDYLLKLVNAGLNTVFLQFDTLISDKCKELRGSDIIEKKKQAIRNCTKAGVGVVLVSTVKKGCNDSDVGEILEYAASNMPTVRGVHFQPMSYFGRFDKIPSGDDRITIPELLSEIETQSKGKLKLSDFSPGGAEHPMCSFHADYTIYGENWILNQSTGNAGCCCSGTSDAARNAVASKWSIPDDLPDFPEDSGYNLSALDKFLDKKKSKTLAVSGMAFQDAWTVDLSRLSRCYINIVSDDGKLMPFCAYNLTALDGRGLYRNGG